MTKLVFDDLALHVTSSGSAYAIQLNGETHQVEVIDVVGGRLDLRIDGRRLTAHISADAQDRWVTVAGRTFRLTKSSATSRGSASHDGSSELAAPMPGQVRTVSVATGDAVTKGQVLLVLEAMKMEIRLQAPYDGQVISVDASVGQTVEREQVLVRLNRV